MSSSKSIFKQWTEKFVEGYFRVLILGNGEAYNEIPWSVLSVSKLRF
jgi:hypothetical protein